VIGQEWCHLAGIGDINLSRFFQFYAKFFPERAMKGFIASKRIARLDEFTGHRRSFDSVAGRRSRYDLQSESRSPNSAIYSDVSKLREHVRQLEQNNGHVSGPIKRNVRNVVGKGIRFQSAITADDSGRRLEFPKINEKDAEIIAYMFEKQFAVWQKQADKRLLHSFYEQQGLAEGALMRDGECLVIGRESKRRGRIIPYCLEVLEADRLTTPPSEINNPKIRHGIEYDEEGVPKTYYLLKVHPGETLSLAGLRSDFEEVPAYFKSPGDGTLRKVMHLFNPLRPEQSRGFSEFAAGLKDLHDMDRYMDAEKLAALEDACMTGIVKTNDPQGFQSAYTDPNTDRPEGYERINEFAPNMMHYLMPNEEFDLHKPNRPNDQFETFINQLMRGPSNALDMPPEVFSQNWQGMNYSNARTVLLNFYAACAMRQWYLVNHLCIPVWENVGTRLIIRGKVRARGFDRRKDDFLKSDWIPAVFRKWIDPKKEAEGITTDLNNMVEILPDVLAERGKDFDAHIEKKARSLKKIQKVEEKYGVKLTAEPKKPQKETEKEDKDDEERTVLSLV